MSAVLFLLFLPTLISAQSLEWGSCPTPDVKSKFLLSLYMGKWYEIQKIPAFFAPGKCLEVKYKLVKDNVVQVLHKQIYKDVEIKRGGSLVVTNKTEPAKLGFNFSYIQHYHPYWVLDTDYFHYAVVFSCTNILHVFNYQYVWIIGRKRSLSPKYLKKAKDLLDKQGINISKLVDSDQSCTN